MDFKKLAAKAKDTIGKAEEKVARGSRQPRS